MRDTRIKKSYIMCAISGAAMFMLSCGKVDTQARPSKDDSKSSETSQTVEKSTVTIGQTDFEVTYAGDFNDPVCLVLKNTLSALPQDVEMIAQVGGKYPEEIFRLDVLIDALRRTDLPFIHWETIPKNERKRAVFSAEWATAGHLEKLDSQAVSGEVEFSFHIFDEPHTLERDEQITYNKWRTLPDVFFQESWPIQKYRLNNIYTLYDIKPEHPIQKFSEENILNWEGDVSPYLGSNYDIIGPSITLRYPFRNGAAEFSLGGQFNYPNVADNAKYSMAELIWDGEFLTAISSEYGSSAMIDDTYSIKVTKFNPADFISVEVLDSYRKPAPIKQIQARQTKMLLEPKSVDICDVTLLPETVKED